MLTASEARDLAKAAWNKNLEDNKGVVGDTTKDVLEIVQKVAEEGGKAARVPLAEQWAYACTELLRDNLIAGLEALRYEVEIEMTNAERKVLEDGEDEIKTEQYVQPYLKISWDTVD